MQRTTIPYFLCTLMLFAGLKTHSQTPGGIPVKAWYRADAAITLFSDAGSTPVSNNGTVYQWNDFTGNGFHLIQTSSGSRPVFSTTTLANFNPTVTFDGSNDWLQYTAPAGVNIIDRATGTLYASGYMKTQKRSGFLGFNQTMDYPGLHFYSSFKTLLYTSGGPGYQGLTNNAMTPNTYFFTGGTWQNDGGNPNFLGATVSLNGDRKTYLGSEMNNVNLGTSYRDLRIGADNNYGAFSGQLNELMVFEDRLTPSELDQLESYLAIKYGTTFASGTLNYKNSVGATVWDASANNGYHFNIAGIARDDNGELYQKQSWSTNSGYQVLIGVGPLANTNSDNPGTLTDGQYLIWGDNGLEKAPTVVTGDFPGISHIFPAIWKVQNTGNVGSVRVAWPKTLTGLALIQSSDAIFNGSDLMTSMASNEITINGVIYNYADVVLTDGSYFTFGAKLSAPGGVTTGLIMWHKADDGTAGSGQKDTWRDMSGNNRHVAQNNNANYRPLYITDANYAANSKNFFFNFNPFYYFDGTNDFFYRQSDDYFTTSNSPGSAYSVVQSSAATGHRTLFGWGDDDPNLVKYYEYYDVWRDNGRVIHENLGVSAFPAHIAGMAWKGATNGIYLNVNGRVYSTTSTNIGLLNSGKNFVIGAEGVSVTGSATERYQGSIAEVFAYNEDHQNSVGTEKLRINSYLALKYGITLKDDAGAESNYMSSEELVVWNAASNSGYNNNIAGLSRDDNSALHQKQARSINSGYQILIGTTGIANTNATNGVGLTDGQFLIWGDNGLARVPSVPFTGVSGVNYRFPAVWKAQNTGNVGTVRVTWPTGLVNPTLVQSSDPTFATVDNSTDMSANFITIAGVSYNYADVTLADGEYFTFAAQLNGPAGIGSNLRVWLRSDAGFDPATWTDFSGNGNNYLQNSLSRQPFISSKMYNFNPVVDFGNTGSDARFMAKPAPGPFTTDISNSTLFSISASKSSGTYADIIGFGSGNPNSGALQQANDPVFIKYLPNNYKVLYPLVTTTGLPTAVRGRLYLDDVSYTNGVSETKYGMNGAMATVPALVSTASQKYASGSIVGSQVEELQGVIGEVIAYERDLTDIEKEQVRSYLALKYGITLAHNYLASQSTTVVWDRTTNTGYNNNIAGIARDDNGSLQQKQSQSINDGLQVLISTTGLADNNAANSQLLNDMQYLIWGDNGQPRSFGVTLDGIPNVNRRIHTIWKVQNTNSTGTVRVAWYSGLAHLTLLQSDDETFDATDLATPMTGTITVNGTKYNYADVVLSDGQYFSFAAFLQAPGGVTNGLLMWHKADASVMPGGPKDMWLDVSGNNKEVYQPNNNDYRPLYVPEAVYSADSRDYFFNFNPFFYFDGTNDFFYNEGITYFPATNSPGSAYGVMQGSGATGERTVFGWGIDDPSLERSTNNYIIAANGGNNLTQNVGAGNASAHFGAMHWVGSAPGIYLNYNGRIYSNANTLMGIQDPVSNRNFAIGSQGSDLSGDGIEWHQGGIAEVFAYSVNHHGTNEQARINSYLALKYGITLSKPDGSMGSPDYLNSKSDVIYAAESTFSFNIAGIGHDFPSALHQKQSRSVNVNSNGQVVIGIGDIAETNFQNTNSLSEGQFLVWGDNGNTEAMTNMVGTYVNFDYAGHSLSRRMNRVWKVQNTGVTDLVKIVFPILSVGETTLSANDECAAYVLVMADDADFTTNVSIVPLTTGENDYEVMTSFPQGVSYFSFGRATPITTGTVYLPETVESTTLTLSNCDLASGLTYFAKEDDPTLKLFAAADVNVNQLTVTITPEGTSYDDGTIFTRLMPRITSVEDASAATYVDGKVRIYYSADELAETMLPGAVTNGWFKYDGNADDVLTDIFSDGRFDAGKAMELIPNATGIEDGVYYVEFHNISSFSSFVFLSSTLSLNQVLPVEFGSFTGSVQGKYVQLQWTTVSESNNLGFTVERSVDAMNWESLGFVASKGVAGNSSVLLQYSYTDKTPASGRSFYRLKQTDMDGQNRYSDVVRIDIRNENDVILLKNPVDNVIVLKGLAAQTKITLFDLGGRLIKTFRTNQSDWLEINVADLRSGIYLLQTEDSAGQRKSFKVIKRQ